MSQEGCILNKSIWKQALTTMPRISDEQWQQLNGFNRWLLAIRASVLLMTLSSAMLAGLLAWHFDRMQWSTWLLVTLGLLLAHATNNLINDATDYWRGVDDDNYFRNQYGVQPLSRGLMSSFDILVFIGLTGACALAIGIYLVFQHGSIVFHLLFSGCFFVLFYTWPLKKWGMGEPAVLLVWGPLMVGGCYYVITHHWSWTVTWVSIAYALGPTSVLFGKHIDKLKADTEKNVLTLPVRLGGTVARQWVVAMLVIQYGMIAIMILYGVLPWPCLLVFIGTKKALHMKQIFQKSKPESKPDHYPESIWPLWYSAYAFDHTRNFGGWLFLGLLLSIIFC